VYWEFLLSRSGPLAVYARSGTVLGVKAVDLTIKRFVLTVLLCTAAAIPAHGAAAQTAPAGVFAAGEETAVQGSTKIARVLAVIDLFGSADASRDTRLLAQFATPVQRVQSGEDLLARTQQTFSGFFEAEYDYFDPSGLVSSSASVLGPQSSAGSEANLFSSLLPSSSQSLIELATSIGLVCPVRASPFYDSWGEPRGNGRVHVGTDLIASKGTPLVAVADGVVLRMDTVDSYVPGTDIDPGGMSLAYATFWGDVFYYAHVSGFSPTLAPGTKISRGETIAYVGQTGNARLSVSHLHIQWHPLGGDPQNPYPLLKKVC
jgi:murein DD-endopeptidase MepM/ murein hydrolase activator NlpD